MTEGEEEQTLRALRGAGDAAGYGGRTRMWTFAVEDAS
jgi:hypothetical protein